MTKVLVVSTSRKTRGGITAVLKLYEQSPMWKQYHCRWIGTHRDGGKVRKVWYLVKAMVQYMALLPFYDIVHIHFSLSNSAIRKYPFFKLAKALHKITVIHLHCGSQIDDIWSPVYQHLFEQCDCGIVLSESLKAKVEEYIGQSKKIKVVYNPCPIISETADYEKKNNILFSGTLYEGKGYKDLLRAFAKIANRYPDWKIVLAGNGEEEQARALAKELNIEQKVELLGWVNDKAKHQAFCEAKALCLPSYAEGFPMAVLDAWAYGLPVITTPVGGIPDVAKDGFNMLLFNPGDVEGLAEKIEKIIVNDSLRSLLSKESKLLSSTQFNLYTICRQLGDLYEYLIN
jgi:glycosyltransferase involved in cell wall biosynthesis